MQHTIRNVRIISILLFAKFARKQGKSLNEVAGRLWFAEPAWATNRSGGAI